MELNSICELVFLWQALLDMLNASSMFVGRARDAPPEQQFFTDVELTAIDKLIVDTQVSGCYFTIHTQYKHIYCPHSSFPIHVPQQTFLRP